MLKPEVRSVGGWAIEADFEYIQNFEYIRNAHNYKWSFENMSKTTAILFLNDAI